MLGGNRKLNWPPSVRIQKRTGVCDANASLLFRPLDADERILDEQGTELADLIAAEEEAGRSLADIGESD